MKITTIAVEANADELRQCNTVADGVLNILRSCFNGGQFDEEDAEDSNPDVVNEQMDWHEMG